MIIEKKILPKYFAQIVHREKNFELRLADFTAEKGDVLILREWDNEYTGKQISKVITGVIKPRELYNKKDIEKYGLQIITFN